MFKNDDNTVSVTAGNDYYEVNGKKLTFENAVYENLVYNAPVIINGSFYLPKEDLVNALVLKNEQNEQDVQNEKKEIKLEEQRLSDIEGITNARQLGGYVNTNGKKIKQNVIIRTGKPSDGTEADLELLAKKYKVSDMVDFRTESEAQMAPEPTVEGAVNHHIPLNIAGDMSKLVSDDFKEAYKTAMQNGNRGEYLVLLAESGMLPTTKMYEGFFMGDEAAAGYKQFFDILLNKPEDAAVLFHCSQGKDRTGMGSALFLYALDFDDDTVMQDYLLTNEANKAIIEEDAKAASEFTDDPEMIEQVKMIDGVDSELLLAVTDKMKAEYGSVKEYLRTKIGLTDDDFAKLEALYLESAEN